MFPGPSAAPCRAQPRVVITGFRSLRGRRDLLAGHGEFAVSARVAQPREVVRDADLSCGIIVCGGVGSFRTASVPACRNWTLALINALRTCAERAARAFCDCVDSQAALVELHQLGYWAIEDAWATGPGRAGSRAHLRAGDGLLVGGRALGPGRCRL